MSEKPNYNSIHDDDRHVVDHMGYKQANLIYILMIFTIVNIGFQDLHRGLNAFMNFAFGYTEVGVLVGICSIYDFVNHGCVL